MNESPDISAKLGVLMTQPSLALARQLEQELTTLGYRKIVFGGRINQKAPIEAASEGDRGAVERIANAFDASLTAAREKWLRLFEQLSPIYKWTPGGSRTVQSCPRRRASLATNAKPRWATRGAPRIAC